MCLGFYFLFLQCSFQCWLGEYLAQPVRGRVLFLACTQGAEMELIPSAHQPVRQPSPQPSSYQTHTVLLIRRPKGVPGCNGWRGTCCMEQEGPGLARWPEEGRGCWQLWSSGTHRLPFASRFFPLPSLTTSEGALSSPLGF